MKVRRLQRVVAATVAMALLSGAHANVIDPNLGGNTIGPQSVDGWIGGRDSTIAGGQNALDGFGYRWQTAIENLVALWNQYQTDSNPVNWNGLDYIGAIPPQMPGDPGYLDWTTLSAAELTTWLDNGWVLDAAPGVLGGDGLELTQADVIAQGDTLVDTQGPTPVNNNTTLGNDNIIGQLATYSSIVGSGNTIQGGTEGEFVYVDVDGNPIDLSAHDVSIDGPDPLWVAPIRQWYVNVFGSDNTVGRNSSNVSVFGDLNTVGDDSSFATAVGFFNRVLAEGATAIGNQNRAEGVNSFAAGSGSQAIGDSSVAIGDDARAELEGSIAIGAGAIAESSVAVGAGAHAEGANTTALGDDAHAQGDNSVALGADTSAEGANSVALGTGSIADEDDTVSVGDVGAERRIVNVAAGVGDADAVNMGQFTTEVDRLDDRIDAEEAARIAEDLVLHGRIDDNVVRLDDHEVRLDDHEVRIGQNEDDIVDLDGRVSSAEGDIVDLDGRVTTAEDDIVDLDGRVTTAEDDIVDLDGRVTTAEDDIVDLDGRVTTAEDDIVDLDGRVTTAEGDIAQNADDILQNADDILAEETARIADVARLDAEDLVIHGRVDAHENQLNGDRFWAAGGIAEQPDGIAIGAGALASSEGSIAIGQGAVALNSVAIGVGAQASGVNSMALGDGAIAQGNNSVALGANSVATRPNTVGVGGRQITDVAPGTHGTDAVNVDQLSAVDGKVNANTRRIAANRRLISESRMLIDQNAQAINSLDRKVDKVKGRAYSGVAAAATLSGMSPSAVGRTVVMAGVAYYEGEAALGVNATHRMAVGDQTDLYINGGVAVTTDETVLPRLMVGLEF